MNTLTPLKIKLKKLWLGYYYLPQNTELHGLRIFLAVVLAPLALLLTLFIPLVHGVMWLSRPSMPKITSKPLSTPVIEINDIEVEVEEEEEEEDVLDLDPKLSKNELFTAYAATTLFQNAPYHDSNLHRSVNDRINTLSEEEIREEQESVQIVWTPEIKALMRDFLLGKIAHGSPSEKAVYGAFQNEDGSIDLNAYALRMTQKRFVYFLGTVDAFALRDGTQGTFDENPSYSSTPNVNIHAHPLYQLAQTGNTIAAGKNITLEEYPSYDEIMVWSLMSMSAKTTFFSNGTRGATGRTTFADNERIKGIATFAVGARLEKSEFAEWQYMVVTASQNTKKQGYGQAPGDENGDANTRLSAFARHIGEFPEGTLPTHEEVEQRFNSADSDIRNAARERYTRITTDYLGNALDSPLYLDKIAYKNRFKMVYKAVFHDAIVRAQDEDRDLFIRTSGIGLGVWAGPRELATEAQLCAIQAIQELINEMQNDPDLGPLPSIEIETASTFGPLSTPPVGSADIKVARIPDAASGAYCSFLPDRYIEAYRAHGKKAPLIVSVVAWDGACLHGNEGMSPEVYFNDPSAGYASDDPVMLSCTSVTVSMLAQGMLPVSKPVLEETVDAKPILNGFENASVAQENAGLKKRVGKTAAVPKVKQRALVV